MNMTRKLFWESFRFPILTLILMIAAVLADEVFRLPLPFPAALVPLVIAGGAVCLGTLAEVFREREVTTEILVVLALIGTVFTGEYMEGAEVAFMLLLGEGLEDFAMGRARNAVDMLLADVPSSAFIGQSTPDGAAAGHPQTAADVLSASAPDETSSSDAAAGRSQTTADILLSRSQGDLQKLTDRFAKFFLPLILLACFATFLFTRDIHRVMSILVIACPCSLVLSGPSAVLASVENAARHGVFAASRDDAKTAAYAKTLAKRTRRVIWENILLFACLMNFVGIALSGFGHLHMVHGAIFHNLATVCVLLNSMRLLR